jgi:hypothetical protein
MNTTKVIWRLHLIGLRKLQLLLPYERQHAFEGENIVMDHYQSISKSLAMERNLYASKN